MGTLKDLGRDPYQPIEDLSPDQLIPGAALDRHSTLYAHAADNAVKATIDTPLSKQGEQ